MAAPDELDFSEAVEYHYGKFPPLNIDAKRANKPLARAMAALARYDQMLKGMHNNEILLGPLRSREAVISSRIEGTITTLDELLRYEADQEGEDELLTTGHRNETIETFLYARALKAAQKQMESGQPLSPFLLRSAHRILLGFGRGAQDKPGEFKTDQNYLADRQRKKVYFIPIKPERLQDGLEALFNFIKSDEWDELTTAAISHVEFEALHPFRDGNGRIGRMLITLMLWDMKLISNPHFYVSGYFDQNRDEYIDRMRNVSARDEWTDWTLFFLDAVEQQANLNLAKAEEIRTLYETMKGEFQRLLSSQWAITALDFMFERPVFRNNIFLSRSGIPAPTAYRLIRLLAENGYLRTLEASSGRRPALYSFEALLKVARE